MHRFRMLIAMATVILAIPTRTSCSWHYINVYHSEISQNQQSLQRIRLGMTSDELRSVMGEGERVQYGKLHLVDPWRSESFYLKDGVAVLVLSCVTQPPRHRKPASDRETTPIVLENDKVVGWGWSFLNQNLDRYQISSPKDQREPRPRRSPIEQRIQA